MDFPTPKKSLQQNFVSFADSGPHANRNEAQKDRQGPQALLCLAEVLAWLKQATETHTDEEEATTKTTTGGSALMISPISPPPLSSKTL